MKQKAIPAGRQGNVILIVLILAVAAAAIGFLIYQNMQLKKAVVVPIQTVLPVITPTPTVVPTPSPVPTPALKAGWKMYTNAQYGFEFSYPENYKVLTDKENLYGWPKAILLLYKGGQSYDLAVELWNTEAEYKTEHPDVSTYVVFKTKDGKFITLLNQNKDPEVAQIIETFKFTQ